MKKLNQSSNKKCNIKKKLVNNLKALFYIFLYTKHNIKIYDLTLSQLNLIHNN